MIDVSLAVSEMPWAQGSGRCPARPCATEDCYVDRTRVVVDNSKGAEAQFV